MPYFKLSDQKPIKGEKLFALGNPHDLGMIVVPGTYNGLKKNPLMNVFISLAL